MKIRRKPQPEEDFQMAPMIDMVFLLLVFFMTVSTLAQDEKEPLELPESERSNVPEEAAGRGNISLKYTDAHQIEMYVGRETVSLEEMKSRIESGLASNPDLEINVRAEKEIPFGEIKRVLKSCAEAGAYKIIYATYQKN